MLKKYVFFLVRFIFIISLSSFSHKGVEQVLNIAGLNLNGIGDRIENIMKDFRQQGIDNTVKKIEKGLKELSTNFGQYINSFTTSIVKLMNAIGAGWKRYKIGRIIMFLGILITYAIFKPIIAPIIKIAMKPLTSILTEVFTLLTRKLRLWGNYKFRPMTDKEIVGIEDCLDKILNSVEGHVKAKKTIKTILITNLVNKFQNIKFRLKRNVASICEIYGNPGIGKTELIKRLCSYLCKGKKPFIITSAMIDQKSKRTVLEQILYKDEKKKAYTDFYYYIRTVPYGHIIFDEFDKFWQMDPVGLTEFFRGILDLGYILIDGQKIDCSNLSFYITFNKYGDNGLTHDESYKSRIQVINFKDLTARNMTNIILNRLEEMSEKVFKQCKVSLIYKKKMVKRIGECVAKQKKGFRPANMLLDNLASRIFLLWVSNYYRPLNVNLYLSYNKFDDGIKFTIEKKLDPQNNNLPNDNTNANNNGTDNSADTQPSSNINDDNDKLSSQELSSTEDTDEEESTDDDELEQPSNSTKQEKKVA